MLIQTNPVTTEQIALFLATTELFAEIPSHILNEMAQSFQITYLAGDEVLFQQGEVADSLYVVMYGFIHAIQEQSDGNRRVIAEMGAGSIIGEIACLIDVTRLASICAVRDSILLKMTRDVFYAFLEKHPMTIMGITQQCISRLVAPKKQNIKSSITCFTLIPASNFKNLADFSHQFIEKLSQYGDILLLTQNSFDEIHGTGAAQTSLDSAKSAEIISWIQTLESKYRFIVFVADQINSWAYRCLRQADKILLVGQLSDSPLLNELEKAVFLNKKSMGSNVELVLLANSDTQLAYGTKNWFYQRDLARHYNIRRNKESDMNSFIRLITGNGIGLVMSGGGARALAHIGLIRALEELHISVDYIAGTSMGALIGGCLALEMDHQTILDTLADLFHKFNKKIDYTLPISAIIKAKLLGQLMRNGYGEQTMIEELWKKFFCVSTDISANELYVHQDALLWKAIRSSIALPTIFPATHDRNNHIHVDGGILNNLPVDIMLEKINGGKIIASSLQIRHHIPTLKYEDDTTSGWYLFLKHILLPKIWRIEHKKNFIALTTVMHESMLLGSSKHQQEMEKLADYNVVLDIDNFSLLNFKPIRKIAELGYQQAMRALEHSDLTK
ncbi:MAG: patatin-like phospholipase family protein [Legionellales bacterium]